MSGPFEPPRQEAVVVSCNDREGTLAIVGDAVVFRPLVGDQATLAICDLVVATSSHNGRYSFGIIAAAIAFLAVDALRVPFEATFAVPVWIGILAWGVGTQLFPDVRLDLEGADETAWKLTSHDAALAPLAREVRRRMPTASRRTTPVEMLTDSVRTLVWPGVDFPWHRRAMAAWLVASLPGPTLFGVYALAWGIARGGGSGLVAFLGGLGCMVALGPVALLPGLLLQIPMMWVLQRSGLVRAGVSSTPPEAG